MKRKRAHLDDGVIRFGRAETWIAIITIGVALTSLVGTLYVSLDEVQETKAKVMALENRQAGMDTKVAVTSTEVRRNREDITEIKTAVIAIDNKLEQMILAGFAGQ